jgi:hypothetical protein
MGFVEHMVAGAEKATGDTIRLAGLFQPKGAEGAVLGGEVAGLAVGGALASDQMFNVGTLGGKAAEAASAGPEGIGEPTHFALQGVSFVVALSDSKIHILRPTEYRGIHHEKLELLHTFERHHVLVTAHAGMMVRTLVIEDPKTGVTVELESERNWKSHSKPVVAALVADTLEDEGSDAEDPD